MWYVSSDKGRIDHRHVVHRAPLAKAARLATIFARFICVTLFLSAIHSTALAVDVPQSFTLDGRLYSDTAGTVPLADASILFRIQILDEDKVCVLYEEQQTYSTLASKGYFSIPVGTAIGSPNRNSGDSGNSMASVFQNITSISGKLATNGNACTAVATGGKRRYVRIAIAPSTLGGAERLLSPDINVDSVPNAVVAERAESIQGYRSSELLKVNTAAGAALSQSNLESLFTSNTRFTALSDVVDGTSTSYMRSNSAAGAQLPVLAGAPTAPTTGSVWYDSSDSKIKYQSGGGPIIVGTSVGTSALSGITQATTSNSIDSLNHAQTWNWSTATTGVPWSISANALTTGTLFDLTTSSASLNSTNGLFRVANTGAATTGIVARIQANSTAGSGLTVLASGNVGIGTTTPSGIFSVYGGTSTTGAGRGIALSAQHALMSGAANVGGNINLTAGNAYALASGGSINLTAGIGNSTFGNIGSPGSVSIGGSNSSGTGGPVSIYGGYGHNGYNGGTVSISGGNIYNTGTGQAGSIAVGGADALATKGGSVWISPGVFSAVPGNVLLAAGAGNVGIGTTGPTTALDLNGAWSVRGMAAPAVSVATQGRIYFDSTANKFKISENNGAYVDLVSSGGSVSGLTSGKIPKATNATALGDSVITEASSKIGIGSATPAETLDVNGAIKIGTTATSNAGTIRWDGTNFQGYTGGAWVNFVPNPPAATACDATTMYPTPGAYSYTVPASFGTITIRVWGGGAAGSNSGGGVGGNGSSSSILSLSLLAGGGTAGSTTGGAGGTSSGGQVNTAGDAGLDGITSSASGAGGSSPNGGAGGQARNASSGGDAGGAPGGGGGGAKQGTSSGSGGGAGAYVEKVYTSATLPPGTSIADIVVGSGGTSSGSSYNGGAGGAGQVSIACATAGQLPANDRGIVYWDSGSHASSTSFVYSASGNVGIGTTNPSAAKLQVSGQVVSTTYDNGAATTFDMNNGNNQFTSASCGAMTLNNVANGAAYTIGVQGAVAGTCVFTAAGYTFRYAPANAATTASTHTIYSMQVMGTNVYVSWISGF